MRPFDKIIHVDMDAFYASVEQRDNPKLKGKPVIVGGAPTSRAVVSTCSYEARKYGVHSAMPSSKAHQLCPEAIFLVPRFDVYKEISKQIRQIFHEYTDLVEPLSLDEAYLDVTENKKENPSATLLAIEICQKIFDETGLTASAGVSFNKFLAKIASDYHKPNGITTIEPLAAQKFVDALPIRKFFGVGKVTEKKMLKNGIKTGFDLRQFSEDELIHLFGKQGSYYHNIANCKDDRKVNPTRVRKSISKEKTFSKDTLDKDFIMQTFDNIANKLEQLLIKYNLSGKTISIKVKYYDFRIIVFRNVKSR